MDFDQNNNLSGPPTQGPGGFPPEPSGPMPTAPMDQPRPQRPRRRTIWRVLLTIVLVFSILANIVLFTALMGLAAVFATGSGGILTEEIVRQGDPAAKIVVVNVQGVIYGDLAQSVHRQLKAARKDGKVKAVIVRVSSPGGTISASDQIYQEIRRYRRQEKRPVVAFMQGIAASGGYYASVACEKIVAEPTAITGSIGVISSYFVVQELLQNKLGILPVTVKSGEKKDWLSPFHEPNDVQLKYIEDRLIKPAFARFLEVVAEGRKGSLTAGQIRPLADGGIFGAKEAVEEKLIDDVGYLDDAIALAKSMAGIQDARVVQYRKPFSLMNFLGYRQGKILNLDRRTLYELGTPEVMYLWSAF